MLLLLLKNIEKFKSYNETQFELLNDVIHHFVFFILLLSTCLFVEIENHFFNVCLTFVTFCLFFLTIALRMDLQRALKNPDYIIYNEEKRTC